MAKFTVLKLPLQLAQYSGLLTRFQPQHPLYPLLTLAIVLNTVNFVLPIGLFMVQHFHDFDQFTQSFGPLSNMVVNLCKTCMFLVTTSNLRQMYDSLGAVATDKSRSNFKFSRTAEQHMEDYMKKFLVVVYLAVGGITWAPLLVQLLEYKSSGVVVQNRWNLPFKSSYIVFDLESSPAYEIAYFIAAIGIPACANCIVAIDGIFMGLCLHAVALYRDLKDRLRETDTCGPAKFARNMKRAVKYHVEIGDMVRGIERVFSRIFFVQFNGTIFILCSQSYMATLNVANGQILSNVTFYLASATQFFIYTYFGDLVAIESQSVADAVMALDWHRRKPSERRFYQMIIHRAQHGRGLSYLKWVYCNLHLYVTLILTSYNVFNVLRNINRKRLE